MSEPYADDLLTDVELDVRQVPQWVAQLEDGTLPIRSTRHGCGNLLSIMLLVHAGKGGAHFKTIRPLLDCLSRMGQSPFAPLATNGMTAYLELVSRDLDHPAIDWCLALPESPTSPEPTPAQRLRSDSLEAILRENPYVGDVMQSSALQLFGFKLLETWGDGRTTLDRILHRHYEHAAIQGHEPHKDFEFAQSQRGFTRLLKQVLAEDPHSPHIHAVRWHAWHHAHRAHARLHKAGFYKEWGTESWQASLRTLDKTMCSALSISRLPVAEQEDRLWKDAVSYALSRPPVPYLAAVMGAAGAYYWIDAAGKRAAMSPDKAGTNQYGLKSIPSPDTGEKLQFRCLETARAVVHALQQSSVKQVLELFQQEIGLVRLGQYIADSLPVALREGRVAALTHPAIIPCLLPLIVNDALWAAQGRNFDEALLQGAPWPDGGPWDEMTNSHDWQGPAKAMLQSHRLQKTTHHPAPTRPSPRRI